MIGSLFMIFVIVCAIISFIVVCIFCNLCYRYNINYSDCKRLTKLQRNGSRFGFIRYYYLLEDKSFKDEILEKYDIAKVFAVAQIGGGSDWISLYFDRDSFTETMHQKIKQIQEQEPRIINSYAQMERVYAESYMPKIEYLSKAKPMRNRSAAAEN